MDKETIELRKRLSRLIKECRQSSKQHECLWCGKKSVDFCQSHTIPRCVLKNIAIEGKVSTPYTLAGLTMLDEEVGVASVEIFPLICKECDSRVFQGYEDLEKLRTEPMEQMLEQIALKNTLYHIWKRHFEIAWFKRPEVAHPLYPTDLKQKINQQDLNDFLWDYHRIKKMLEGDGEGAFRLMFWKKLPYVVPIAFQGQISVYGDLNGEVVSNIYDWRSNIRISHMHLCIFPLRTQSVVFAFYHIEDHEYDKLCEQFKALEEEELLSVIGYLLIVYSEDFVLARRFPHRTYCISKLKEVFENYQVEFWTEDKAIYDWEVNARLLWLKNRDRTFPTFLGPKYAMRG